MDRIYLNKIITYIVEDTFFTDIHITFPFWVGHWFLITSIPIVLEDKLPHPVFIEYCSNIYPLSEEEINYMWKKYKSIILEIHG